LPVQALNTAEHTRDEPIDIIAENMHFVAVSASQKRWQEGGDVEGGDIKTEDNTAQPYQYTMPPPNQKVIQPACKLQAAGLENAAKRLARLVNQ
jgi:hypothetical protein